MVRPTVVVVNVEPNPKRRNRGRQRGKVNAVKYQVATASNVTLGSGEGGNWQPAEEGVRVRGGW